MDVGLMRWEHAPDGGQVLLLDGRLVGKVSEERKRGEWQGWVRAMVLREEGGRWHGQWHRDGRRARGWVEAMLEGTRS